MKAWHAVASYIFRYTLLSFPQPIPVVEGVSKLSFQCGSRGCIKIMKDAKKGCGAAQLCLTPGEA